MSFAPAPTTNGHHPQADLEEMAPLTGGPIPPTGNPIPPTGNGPPSGLAYRQQRQAILRCKPVSGFVHIPDIVMRVHEEHVLPATRVLYGLIFGHNGKEGCFPSIEDTLSPLLDCCEKTVRVHLAALEAQNWVQVRRRKHQVNHYLFPLAGPHGFKRVSRKVLYDWTLSPEARYAYMLLTFYQRDDQNTCQKRIRTLADDARVEVRTFERWLAELHQADLYDTEQHRRRPAERRVHIAAPGKKKAPVLVKAEDTKSGILDPTQNTAVDPTQNTAVDPTGITAVDPTQNTAKGNPFNEDSINETPLPGSSQARPPACENNDTQGPPSAAPPRNGACGPIRGASAAGGVLRDGFCKAEGTDSFRVVEAQPQQQAFAYPTPYGVKLTDQFSETAPLAPHPSEGRASPNGPAAGPPADKTKVVTKKVVRLLPDTLRLAHGPERPSEALKRQVLWAAELYRKDVYATSTSAEHVLVAQMDICAPILMNMGRNKEKYEEFIAYLQQEAWYFAEGGSGVKEDPRKWWHRCGWLLYREWFAWWQHGCPKKKSVGRLMQYNKENMPWDECLGCLMSGEPDALTEARLPATEHDPAADEHRPTCLYRTPGLVGPDDWRFTHLYQALRAQEKAA